MQVKALKAKNISTEKVESVDNTVNLVMVLDETGSMEMIKKATIDSVNEFISSQKKVEGSCNLTLYTFSDISNFFNSSDKNELPIRKIVDTKDISEVELLTHDSYDPHGMTNLYDAVGFAIKETSKRVETGNVLVVIITDGDENSSKEFNESSVRNMIEEKQAAGWTFVYLGANQDAWSVGSKMGLSSSQTMTYDVGDMKGMMNNLSASTAVYRSVATASSRGVGDYKNFFGNEDNEK